MEGFTQNGQVPKFGKGQFVQAVLGNSSPEPTGRPAPRTSIMASITGPLPGGLQISWLDEPLGR